MNLEADLEEIEDILYGLVFWDELEPTTKRTKAMMDAAIRFPDIPELDEMAGIWLSGHGVTSSPKRIKALELLNSKIR